MTAAARNKAGAVGYARVSTEGQAVEGASLEAQRARIEAWCQVNDFELISVHAEAELHGRGAGRGRGRKSGDAEQGKQRGKSSHRASSRVTTGVAG